MSTRANIVVKSEDHEAGIQLYRHCDGYPDTENGVIADLPVALKYAWDQPRMEADDMAAAIIRAWKEHGGTIYIDGTANGLETLHGDIEYCYVVSPDEAAGKWKVEAFKAVYDIKLHGIGSLKPLWSGHIGDTYNKKRR